MGDRQKQDGMEVERSLSNFKVEKINATRAREFIIQHHYSGTCHNGPMTWGCYDTKNGNELVGVIAFATPISENVRKSIWESNVENRMKGKTTELHRLVTLDSCPKNTESWFISRGLKSLKNYKPKYKAVISFADSTEGHKGTIYKASNAIYYGKTGEHTFYRDDDGALRPPRQNGKNITIDEAKERGWDTERRSHKHRYLFLMPDEYELKSEVSSLLDVEQQPYP